jgi:hypothetical protein
VYWPLAQFNPARMVHEVTRVELSAQGIIVKHIDAAKKKSLSPQYSQKWRTITLNLEKPIHLNHC